jgi:hypothetical protein
MSCPHCGGETTFGYGLAFGGVGGYLLCLDCDWFEKEVTEPGACLHGLHDTEPTKAEGPTGTGT